MEKKIDQILAILGGVVERQDRLESKIDGLESRMERLEAKVDGLESRTDRVEAHLSKLTEYVKDFRQEVREHAAATDAQLSELRARGRLLEHKVGVLEGDVAALKERKHA